MFLGLEVRMRFKVLYDESNIIHYVAKIYQWWKLWLLHNIIEWKSIHYFACWLETPLSTTKENLAHKWIMKMTRLEFKSLRFQEGNMSVMQNQLGLSRNQQVLSSSLIITIGKRSIVKDLNKLKIHKVFSKKQSLW